MSGEIVNRRVPTIEDERPIGARHLLAAVGGGLLGTLLMLPIAVGVPGLLGVFDTDPLLNFAETGEFFGLTPTVTLGVALFALGGAVVLPLVFLVAGSFLPPQEPRWLRGVSFATITWVGFAPAFWPGGDALTVATFLVASLVGHWVYGATLAGVLSRTAGIPQHRV